MSAWEEAFLSSLVEPFKGSRASLRQLASPGRPRSLRRVHLAGDSPGPWRSDAGSHHTHVANSFAIIVTYLQVDQFCSGFFFFFFFIHSREIVRHQGWEMPLGIT